MIIENKTAFSFDPSAQVRLLMWADKALRTIDILELKIDSQMAFVKAEMPKSKFVSQVEMLKSYFYLFFQTKKEIALYNITELETAKYYLSTFRNEIEDITKIAHSLKPSVITVSLNVITLIKRFSDDEKISVEHRQIERYK